MVVTPKRARQNRLASALLAFIFFLILLLFSYFRAETLEQLWMFYAPGVLLVAVGVYLFSTRKYRRRARLLKKPFPTAWREILIQRALFYRTLDATERQRFEAEVRIFLAEKRITGIKTDVDDTTRLLVAASAVIPIFGFPEWEYDNLAEVLIYPSAFDDEFQLQQSKQRHILGLVGSAGALNRMMILSKPDLFEGFEAGPGHVGIHEFAHLVDGADGDVDGIPAAACAECAKPWIEVMRQEMVRLRRGDSILNRYGLTGESEFFAVATEAFFKEPNRLAQRHPELFDMLQRIFAQDTTLRATLRSIVRA